MRKEWEASLQSIADIGDGFCPEHLARITVKKESRAPEAGSWGVLNAPICLAIKQVDGVVPLD